MEGSLRSHSMVLSFSGFEVRQLCSGGTEKTAVSLWSGEGASFQRCWIGPCGKAPMPKHPPVPRIRPVTRSFLLSQADLGSQVPALPLGSGHRDGDNLHGSKEPDALTVFEGVLGRACFSRHQGATPQGTFRCGPSVETVPSL